ncbi:MAG TPA: hypothetical protein DDW67_08205, partial [Elusimicrobia bacterium]|nr:hypothetical protein [Elusimicrobiota bacterium]
MKKTLIAVSVLLAAASAAQAAQKIVTYDQAFKPGVKAAIKWMGGSVVREFRLINAVVADIPEHIKSVDIYSVEGVRDVADDSYIRWIESAPASMLETPLPDMDSFLGAIGPDSTAIPEARAEAVPAANEVPWGVARVNAAAAW